MSVIRPLLVVSAWAAATLGGAPDLRGQCESARHAAPIPRPDLGFGAAVSVWEASTLVGARGRAAFVFAPGAAPARLDPPGDGRGDDGFGAAVALHDGLAAVGAPNDSLAGPGAGAVHLYATRAGAWVHTETLRPRGVGRGPEGFGTALALQHDTLLVGRPGNDSGGDDRGAVDVYLRSVDGFRLVGQLTEDGGTAPFFGSAIALDGDRAAVSTPGDGLGAAFVFERDVRGYWGQVARLESAHAPVPGIDFGRALALHGDFVVVGAPWAPRAGSDDLPRPALDDDARDERPALDDDARASGALYVYTLVDELWTEVDVLRAPDALPSAPMSGLGASVALRGHVVVAGAPTGPRGSVQVFARQDAASPFVPGARLFADEDAFGAPTTGFGAAVALDDAHPSPRLAVGAPDAGTGGAWHAFAALPTQPPVVGLGDGLPGARGSPCLCGALDDHPAGASLRVSVRAAPRATGVLVLGARAAALPFAGGLLVPAPDVLLPVQLDAAGRLDLATRADVLRHASVVLQAWLADAASPAGWSASNALLVGIP